MTRRRRWSEDELIWAAYSEAPAEIRLIASINEMDAATRAIWLAIVKRNLASGWEPPE